MVMSIGVLTPFFHPHIGGMERALGRITSALAHVGVSVQVHTSRFGWPAQSPVERLEDGVLVRREAHNLSDWSRAARIWVLGRPFDAVLIASFGPDTRDETGAAALELSRRGIHTIWRSPTADHALRNLSDGNAYHLRGIATVVTNSIASAERTTQATSHQDVVVIPNMILQYELDEALHDARASRLCDVAWVGRVTRRKRPAELLKFMATLAEHQTVCIQAAPAFGEDELFTQFLAAAPKKVELYPPSPSQPMAIRRAAVFVHMSDVEGSPNAVLEAAARGSALLTSNIPECRELIEGLAGGTSVDFGQNAVDTVLLLASRSNTATRVNQHQVVRTRHSERALVNRWTEVLFP